MEIDIIFILVIIFSGLMAGYASGLFGIGGGVILVPVLIVIFEHYGNTFIGAHTAIGTSLAITIPNAFMSSKKQYEQGNVDMIFFKKWSGGLITGALIGGICMLFVSGIVLKILFLCLLILSLIALIRNYKEPVPSEKQNFQYRRLFVGSTLISGFSVLLGISGGTFTVPFCKKSLRFTMKKAVAISSLSSLVIGFMGAIIAMIIGSSQSQELLSYSIGYVNIIAFLIILPLSIWFAPKGVVMSQKLPEKTVHKLFIGLLIICIAILSIKTFF